MTRLANAAVRAHRFGFAVIHWMVRLPVLLAAARTEPVERISLMPTSHEIRDAPTGAPIVVLPHLAGGIPW